MNTSAFKRALSFALTITLLAIGSPIVATAQTVSFQGLGFLPSTSPDGSWATATSSGGSVVVGYDAYSGSLQEAFSWTGGTMTPLGFPNGTTQSKAFGVNSTGSVIVGLSSGAAGYPVIWVNGTPTILPQNTNPNANNAPCGAITYGVNANATAVGSSVVAGQDATPGCGPGVATEWINGSEKDMFPNPISICGSTSSGIAYGVSEDGSATVGTVGYCYLLNNAVQANPTAFVYNNNSGSPTFLSPPSASNSVSSTAYAANSDGSVVVGTIDAPGTGGVAQYAFRWTQATGVIDLGPAATFASALAVNADGSVVVGQMGNGGPAFRWTATSGFQNLQALLTANGAGASLNNWNLAVATGVSADGTEIVGYGQGPNFTPQAWIAHLPATATLIGVNTHDFNGDGYSDIAWRNSDGDVAIWLMNGTTATSAVDITNVPSSWTLVGQRDFNGDGKADLLWRNSDGDVAMWFMNGTTVASAVDFSNVPSSWTAAGTGDFNGDGYGDILWRNSDGDVAIWLMNGTTVTSAVDFSNVPSSWTIAGVGDFNGDGKSDILWRNSDGDVAIWLMNGTTVTSAVDFSNVPSSWTIVGTGDFNGDGKRDILWRNTDGDVAIWLMNGTTATSAVDIANVPSSWSVAVTGDFNGDGKSDILWRNTDGDVAIWFMNGTTATSAVDFSNVPSSWTIQGADAD